MKFNPVKAKSIIIVLLFIGTLATKSQNTTIDLNVYLGFEYSYSYHHYLSKLDDSKISNLGTFSENPNSYGLNYRIRWAHRYTSIVFKKSYFGKITGTDNEIKINGQMWLNEYGRSFFFNKKNFDLDIGYTYGYSVLKARGTNNDNEEVYAKNPAFVIGGISKFVFRFKNNITLSFEYVYLHDISKTGWKKTEGVSLPGLDISNHYGEISIGKELFAK